MRRLVLMADYHADPLWDADSGGMVSLSTLPISDSLKQRLTAWRENWEVINDAAMQTDDFDSDDPAHERETHGLWIALRGELGDGFQVGLPVPPPGPDTRLHVIWEPGGQPELATWHKRKH